jgi:hypothetical protein
MSLRLAALMLAIAPLPALAAFECGSAADVACSGCIGAADIATGAVDADELAATTVSAGAYTSPSSLTVDADGRITAITAGGEPSPLDLSPRAAWIANTGTTSLTSVGLTSSAFTTQGTTTETNVSGYVTVTNTTGAVVNQDAYWTSSAVGYFNRPWRLVVGQNLPAAGAGERRWVAYLGTALPNSFDASNSARYCGIRYSTVTSDTQLMCCSSDGTTASCSNFEAYAAGSKVYSVAVDGGTTCTCASYNILTGAFSSSVAKTSNPPSGANVVIPFTGVRSTGGVNKSMNYIYSTVWAR